MNHCSFCEDENPERLMILCVCQGGTSVCRQCIADEKFNDALMCPVCHIRHGKKLRKMKAEMDANKEGMRFSFGAKQMKAGDSQIPHVQQQGQIYNQELLTSRKKQPNSQGQENQQRLQPTTPMPYGNYMQTMPNFNMPYGMQHYPQQLGPQQPQQQFNPQMMPYWSYFSYPMMIQQPPTFSQWYPTPPPPNYGRANKNTNQPLRFDNKFEQDVFNGLIMNASRPIKPGRNNEDSEDEEKGNWNSNYQSRAQSRTTDYLEETTMRNKQTRMNRSNSVNTLTLRR